MNRIHHPLSAKVVKSKPTVKNSKDIKEIVNKVNLVNINEFKEEIKDDKNDKNEYLQFKFNVEENISLIKQKIENTNDITIENKKEIQQVLKLIEQINSQIILYSQQTEDYKKITNERIEKLAKLFIVINSKLQSKI